MYALRPLPFYNSLQIEAERFIWRKTLISFDLQSLEIMRRLYERFCGYETDYRNVQRRGIQHSVSCFFPRRKSCQQRTCLIKHFCDLIDIAGVVMESPMSKYKCTIFECQMILFTCLYKVDRAFYIANHAE